MDTRNICSFFGHRDVTVTEELCARVTEAVRYAVDRLDCRIFYFGGYGDFDDLCYEIVTKIKENEPSLGIERIFCVPQERRLYKKDRYYAPEKYEDVIYIARPFEGWYKSIYFRNISMIDESHCVIFYAEAREKSGAYKAYKYAEKKKKEKHIFNLWKA